MRQVLELGNFKVVAVIDVDGHLNLAIDSTDGSPVTDLSPDFDLEDNCFRFTTAKIEAAYKAGQ